MIEAAIRRDIANAKSKLRMLSALAEFEQAYDPKTATAAQMAQGHDFIVEMVGQLRSLQESLASSSVRSGPPIRRTVGGGANYLVV